jgi:HAD superfamily hydrolase (TIGR01509 family)
MTSALIFDCDGVIAETERQLHLPAFNQAFAEAGLPMRWTDAEYSKLLLIAGGKERLAAALPRDSRHLVDRVHARKGEIFAERLAAQGLAARPGIVRLMKEADAAGWRLAVASTSSELSVRAVIDNALGPDLVPQLTILAGDVVAAKKPDPAIYELALERLRADRSRAVVIEDSRNGLLAATGAGLLCVITVSAYSANERFDEAALVTSDLGDPGAPMTVIANRTAVAPRECLTLDDLARLLAGSR